MHIRRIRRNALPAGLVSGVGREIRRINGYVNPVYVAGRTHVVVVGWERGGQVGQP
jgi:hypothetical protein